MRRSTIVLGTVFLLLALCGVLFVTGGTLSARVNRVTADAADYPQAFDAIRDVVASGGAPQRFTEPLPESPSACRLEDVTVSLVNRGLIPAEWLSVSVEPAPGDVAVYAVSGEGGAVDGRSAGDINLKLIARADGTGDRVYVLQYYVFGMKRTLRLTH